MRTINQLREAGFTVATATDAVDCTSITSDKPFWFYNTNFCENMADVREHLKPAEKREDGQYRLLFAGLPGDDEVIAFNLIDEERYKQMQDALGRYLAGLSEAQRAKDDYEDAFNTLEPYFT
jgi:hypothetical protein